MRVVVFGAGAVGGLFGGRLALAGHDVTLVARALTVQAVAASGLRLEGLTVASIPVRAVERLPPGTTAERVLLTVKGRDLADAGRAIAGAFPEGVTVVALQNGLGVEERLSRGLSEGGWADPRSWLLRGVHAYGATLVGPGVVRHAGNGEILLPGEDGALADGTVEGTATLFRSGGFDVRLVDDLEREVWRKALVNAAVNPVTADHGVVNGQLLEEPWRGQALALLVEACRAAGLAGVPIPLEEAEAELWRVVEATAKNRSSMLQDLDRGRETEIELISGHLLRVAEAAHEELPHTRRAVARIHRRELEAVRTRSSGPAEANAD